MDKELEEWINYFSKKLDLVFNFQIEIVKLLKEKKSDPHDISGEPNIPKGDGP
jgi:hypothetical protein